jgi:hypothetical protein
MREKFPHRENKDKRGDHSKLPCRGRSPRKDHQHCQMRRRSHGLYEDLREGGDVILTHGCRRCPGELDYTAQEACLDFEHMLAQMPMGTSYQTITFTHEQKREKTAYLERQRAAAARMGIEPMRWHGRVTYDDDSFEHTFIAPPKPTLLRTAHALLLSFARIHPFVCRR